jgi:hypothetical protein
LPAVSLRFAPKREENQTTENIGYKDLTTLKRRIRNEQVIGSIPIIGSNFFGLFFGYRTGGVSDGILRLALAYLHLTNSELKIIFLS